MNIVITCAPAKFQESIRIQEIIMISHLLQAIDPGMNRKADFHGIHHQQI